MALDLMDEPFNSAELIQVRLENWDTAEARAEMEQWCATEAGRTTLSDQRRIDLALRARAGREMAHGLVRDRIVATVMEEIAPRTVRDSIMETIQSLSLIHI